MRISGSRKFSWEERFAHKSKQGRLTPALIREAVERYDSMSAKVDVLLREEDKLVYADPIPTEQTMDNLSKRIEALLWRCRTLSAVPEIRDAFSKREARAKARAS